MYGALVVYIALNVPVGRVLSTPLTWTILRATRGPLADAILHYVTVTNLIALAIPLVAGVVLPRVLKNRGVSLTPAVAIAALAIVVIGPFATSRIETGGLHRNAFGALAATSVTRVAAKESADDWRTSPFEATDEHRRTQATDEHRRTRATDEHRRTQATDEQEEHKPQTNTEEHRPQTNTEEHRQSSRSWTLI